MRAESTTPLVLRWLRALHAAGRADVLAEVERGLYLANHWDADILFAFVMAGKDETGAHSMGVDLAEMLTGEEARDAAVEDGVIEEGEFLPNDFYIDNPDIEYELLRVADEAVFEMIAGEDTTQRIELDVDDFAALYNDTYVGPGIYGVVPLEPIAMDVTVADGLIARAEAVYLP